MSSRDLPDEPIVRPRAPSFGQVGRPPPPGTAWSRGLMLVVAVGVFAALVSLVIDLQTRPDRLRVVEVTFMEEEAAAAEGQPAAGEPGE